MKKLLLMIACTVAFSAPVVAQQTTYACQFTESAGLIKENDMWRITSFILGKPFFLTDENGMLTSQSVSKALRAEGLGSVCAEKLTPTSPLRSCVNSVGDSLLFNTQTLTGGVANILSSAASNNLPKKDTDGRTVYVSTFVCTKIGN